jgi:hypothetical protein
MPVENSYQEEDASKLTDELFSGKLGVAEAQAKHRTRLLDLTMRNRLLNYKHPKGRSFQFADEPDLNLLFERLEDGKSVAIAYVPNPSVSPYDGGKKPETRIYAKTLNIGTSVDIAPSNSSTAAKRLPTLQVIQYPADLERMMRKVALAFLKIWPGKLGRICKKRCGMLCLHFMRVRKKQVNNDIFKLRITFPTA